MTGSPTSRRRTTASAAQPARIRTRSSSRASRASSATRRARRCSSAPGASPTRRSRASAAARTRSVCFAASSATASVKLYGVEAAGHGVATEQHAATLTAGRIGVLHGSKSYVLCDDGGQIKEAHSISAGLDYPGVGPEHAFLKDSGRARYLSATDEEALAAAALVARPKASSPRSRPRTRSRSSVRSRRRCRAASAGPRRSCSASPVAATRTSRRYLDRALPEGDLMALMGRIEDVFARRAAEGKKVLVTYLCVGDPDAETIDRARGRMRRGGRRHPRARLSVQRSDRRRPRHRAREPAIALAGGGLDETLAVARRPCASRTCPSCSSATTTRSSSAATPKSRAVRSAGIDAFLVVDLPIDESMRAPRRMRGSAGSVSSRSSRRRRSRSASRSIATVARALPGPLRLLRVDDGRDRRRRRRRMSSPRRARSRARPRGTTATDRRRLRHRLRRAREDRGEGRRRRRRRLGDRPPDRAWRVEAANVCSASASWSESLARGDL